MTAIFNFRAATVLPMPCMMMQVVVMPLPHVILALNCKRQAGARLLPSASPESRLQGPTYYPCLIGTTPHDFQAHCLLFDVRSGLRSTDTPDAFQICFGSDDATIAQDVYQCRKLAYIETNRLLVCHLHPARAQTCSPNLYWRLLQSALCFDIGW